MIRLIMIMFMSFVEGMTVMSLIRQVEIGTVVMFLVLALWIIVYSAQMLTVLSKEGIEW